MNISSVMYGMWGLTAYMDATWTSSTHHHNQLSGNQTTIDTVSSNTSAPINDTAIFTLDRTFEAFTEARSTLKDLTSKIEDLNWIDSSFKCQETYLGEGFIWMADCIFRGDDDALEDREFYADLKWASQTLAISIMQTKDAIDGIVGSMRWLDQKLGRFEKPAARSCPSLKSSNGSLTLSDKDTEGGLMYLEEALPELHGIVWQLRSMDAAEQWLEFALHDIDAVLNRSAWQDLKSFEVHTKGRTSPHPAAQLIRHTARIRDYANQNLDGLRGILGASASKILREQESIITNLRLETYRLREAWQSTERQHKATKSICLAAEFLGRFESLKGRASLFWCKLTGWFNGFLTQD